MTEYLTHWDLGDQPKPARPSAASLSDVDEDTLVKAAREALTRPSDFGYYGDLPLFESWGFVFFQSAASGTLERSNFRVARASLEEASKKDREAALLLHDGDASDYVQEVGVSHWLVGSADHLAVRVLVDEDGPITADNLTHTFVHAVELALSIKDYPVLDESDFSELESEEQDAAWDSWLRHEVINDITDHFGVDDIAELTLMPPDTKFDGWNTIENLCADTNEEAVHAAYYRHESTEWIEEGTSFYNGQHETVMDDLKTKLFVTRIEQVERAHADANREDAARSIDPNQATLSIEL